MAWTSERRRISRALAAAPLLFSAGCTLLFDLSDADQFTTGSKEAGSDAADVAQDGGEDADAGVDAADAREAGSDADGGSDAGCTALRFANETDTVTIQDSAALAFGSEGTIEAWFLADSVQSDAGEPNIFNKFTFGIQDTRIWVQANLVPLGLLYPSSSLVGEKPAPAGQWNHLALSWSANEQTLYLNGAPVARGAPSSPASVSGTSAHIGAIERAPLAPALLGFVSEVRISNVARYTKAFTPAPHLPLDSSTTALWRLDDGSGHTARDATPAMNDATIAGATWQPAPCR